MLAAGVDVWRTNWVCVVLEDGKLRAVDAAASIQDLLRTWRDLEAVGVDIPIGLPKAGVRQADLRARDFVGPRRSSIFQAPPFEVVSEPTYQGALELSRRKHGRGISAQSYALRDKIREVMDLGDDRIYEVHPEVSFREMNGQPLEFAKTTWNGQSIRRQLLEKSGIEFPPTLENAGRVDPVDIFDAAAAAWSANRIALGEAHCLPDPPEVIMGREVAIWY
jgi:predicted RNase H-like nuclease